MVLVDAGVILWCQWMLTSFCGVSGCWRRGLEPAYAAGGRQVTAVVCRLCVVSTGVQDLGGECVW